MKRKRWSEAEVELCAKAMERQYHREMGGACDRRDGGPSDCWKSMVGYAKAMLAALSRSMRARP